MATTISIEFTDAQWALIQEHYPNNVEDEGGKVSHQAITEDELKIVMFQRVQEDVVRCVKNNAAQAAIQAVASCFEV